MGSSQPPFDLVTLYCPSGWDNTKSRDYELGLRDLKFMLIDVAKQRNIARGITERIPFPGVQLENVLEIVSNVKVMKDSLRINVTWTGNNYDCINCIPVWILYDRDRSVVTDLTLQNTPSCCVQKGNPMLLLLLWPRAASNELRLSRAWNTSRKSICLDCNFVLNVFKSSYTARIMLRHRP